VLANHFRITKQHFGCQKILSNKHSYSVSNILQTIWSNYDHMWSSSQDYLFVFTTKNTNNNLGSFFENLLERFILSHVNERKEVSIKVFNCENPKTSVNET
jgi:hypothetical protein